MNSQDILIGISASYNHDLNAPEEAAKKYLKDITSGSSLQTLPLFRSEILGVDNLKFLYPINGVPIVAYTMINAIDEGICGQNVKVGITGNSEVGKLVDLINDEIKTSIEFTDEGENTSLSNSFDKLFGGKLLKENYFVTGDVPLAKGYTKSKYSADLTIDLNSKFLIEHLNYVKRNFYSRATRNNELHDFKEPNIYHFTPEGYPILKQFTDIFYANRKNGALPTALRQFVNDKLVNDKIFRERFISQATILVPQFFNAGMQASRQFREMAFPINFDEVNHAVSDIFEINFELGFTHKDVFRLIDIDGLNNDFVLYELITKELDKHGKQDARVKKIKLALTDSQNLKEFPLLMNFEDVLREYTNQIDIHLPDQHKINFNNLYSFFEKEKTKQEKAALELTELVLN